MSKMVHEFNDMIRKLRKELFGKGPERIHTVFTENMAIATLIWEFDTYREIYFGNYGWGRNGSYGSNENDSRSVCG